MSTSKAEASSDDSSSISSLGKERHQNDFQNPDSRFEPIQQVPTHRTTHRVEGEDLVNLPSRTLGSNAELGEYSEETAEGQILKQVKSNKTGRIERYELVTFVVGDKENPKNWSKLYKWWCTMIVAITCFVVAFNSAVITANIKGPAEEFHVSEEVALLSITLFVVGFGIGKSSNLNSP
jgi:hypothetical protein